MSKVRCHSVLVHVWNVGFFRLITSMFGRVVLVDESIARCQRFDVAY